MWMPPPVFMPDQPDAVVLNIEPFVQIFRWSIRPHDNYPEYVNDIVHTVICCFTDATVAEFCLAEFADEIVAEAYFDEESGVMIRPEYAKAVLELGTSILKHMHDLRLFSPDGKLNYDYYSYEIPDYPGTVLKRIEREDEEDAEDGVGRR